MYVAEIASVRNFISRNAGRKGIEVFSDYVDNPLSGLTEIANRHNIPVRICTEYVNPFINDLTAEILHDLQAGYLTFLDFAPRKKTTAQALKAYNDTLRENGLTPVKIPRKKSEKQIIKEWRDLKKRMENVPLFECDSL